MNHLSSSSDSSKQLSWAGSQPAGQGESDPGAELLPFPLHSHLNPASVHFGRGASSPPNGVSAASDETAGESSEKLGGKKPKMGKKQTQLLEEIFQQDATGAPDRRALLAQEFGVSQQQITTWFQNRRARERNRTLQSDYEEAQKRLKAALDENQELRKQLEDLRAEHGLCSKQGAPFPAQPAPQAKSRFPLESSSQPSLLPARTFSPPKKRLSRGRSNSEPALLKRARPPGFESTAFFEQQVTAGMELHFGTHLEGNPFGSFRYPQLSSPLSLPTTLSSSGGLTLDEAFRGLLSETSADRSTAPDPFGLQAPSIPPFSAGMPFGGVPTSMDLSPPLEPPGNASRQSLNPPENALYMPPWWRSI